MFEVGDSVYGKDDPKHAFHGRIVEPSQFDLMLPHDDDDVLVEWDRFWGANWVSPDVLETTSTEEVKNV